MSNLNKAVVQGFDDLVNELRSYDDKTEGGGWSLLFSDSFNYHAQHRLNWQERDRALCVARGIHDVMKAIGPGVWDAWFTDRRKYYQGPTQQVRLNQALAGARELVMQADFDHVASCPALPTAFLDRFARVVDTVDGASTNLKMTGLRL